MPVLEKKIEKKVCEYAQKHGFLTPKVTVVSERGWPDRCFIDRDGFHLWVEFKQEGKPLKPIQIYRCTQLTERGVSVLVIDDIEQGKEYVDALVAARVSKESDEDAPLPGERRIILGPGTREN
jgi:hypothetical protein